MIQTAKPAPSSNNDAILAVFKVLSQILAVRLFLLLAVIGSFVLAYIAMNNDNAHSLMVLAVYLAFTVLPLVALDFMNKRHSSEG